MDDRRIPGVYSKVTRKRPPEKNRNRWEESVDHANYTLISKGTYAHILRKVKLDPELIDLGENVNWIRRSHTGYLMTELNVSEQQG